MSIVPFSSVTRGPNTSRNPMTNRYCTVSLRGTVTISNLRRLLIPVNLKRFRCWILDSHTLHLYHHHPATKLGTLSVALAPRNASGANMAALDSSGRDESFFGTTRRSYTNQLCTMRLHPSLRYKTRCTAPVVSLTGAATTTSGTLIPANAPKSVSFDAIAATRLHTTTTNYG